MKRNQRRFFGRFFGLNLTPFSDRGALAAAGSARLTARRCAFAAVRRRETGAGSVSSSRSASPSVVNERFLINARALALEDGLVALIHAPMAEMHEPDIADARGDRRARRPLRRLRVKA